MLSRKECQNCFGTGEEFNGEDLVSCSKCQGNGFILIDSEENYMEEIDFPDYPDNFEEFDEDKHTPKE